LRCRHSCIESRGVSKAGSVTTTTVLLGSFREHSDARHEFLEYVGREATQSP
jgi:GTP cyclohydrolase I